MTEGEVALWVCPASPQVGTSCRSSSSGSRIMVLSGLVLLEVPSQNQSH